MQNEIKSEIVNYLNNLYDNTSNKVSNEIQGMNKKETDENNLNEPNKQDNNSKRVFYSFFIYFFECFANFRSIFAQQKWKSMRLNMRKIIFQTIVNQTI